MRAVRHLSYLLLVPAINGFVDKIASWWNAKQGCRGSNIHVSVAIQGLFTRHQIGFNQKWITAARLWPRVYPFCWIPLPEGRLDIFYVVYHTWLCCTYSHCCFFSPFMMSHSNSLRPVYVKIVLLNISISSSTPIFVLPRGRLCTCQYDQAPQLHVNIAFCNRLAESRLKLVSIYPGVLKRGLHIYYLLIYLSLLWCHM